MMHGTMKEQLASLAGLKSKTDASERGILASAQQRLLRVNSMINSITPKAKVGDENAEQEYLALVNERGSLNMVIAKARENLA